MWQKIKSSFLTVLSLAKKNGVAINWDITTSWQQPTVKFFPLQAIICIIFGCSTLSNTLSNLKEGALIILTAVEEPVHQMGLQSTFHSSHTFQLSMSLLLHEICLTPINCARAKK